MPCSGAVSLPERAMAEPREAPTMSPLTLARHRHAILVGSLPGRATPLGHSARFAVWGLDDSDGDSDAIVVVHDFLPEEIDNNIGGYVADELMPLLARLPRQPETDGYAYSEQETFERYVGAIVRSVDDNERRAWHRFYDNTLVALLCPPAEWQSVGSGVADFNASSRALYARVAELAREANAGSLLDAATCFGFLPLYLCRRDSVIGRVIGCDLNRALVTLADDYRRMRGMAGVAFVEADILAVEDTRRLAAAGPFDVVTALHVLEHLTPEDSATAVANLWSLTGRRLILAVPFEEMPDPRFGHRQAFDPERLQALGSVAGGRSRFFEHHGGWLVIDRDRRTA